VTSFLASPGRRVLPAVICAALAAIALTGCSTNDTGMGTITGNGQNSDLTFAASGATGTGSARTYQVVIDHSSIDGIAPSIQEEKNAYETGVGVYELSKPTTVTMKVTSTVKGGWASCDITWSGHSITKKASGKTAVAWCVATLGES
jgi:hypothetical protein